MSPHGDPTLGRNPASSRGQVTSLTSHLQTLLYGLSAAIALPPDAVLAAPNMVMPAIRAGCHPALHATDLALVLDRPVARIGHGNVALEQVDWRMRSLVASLALSRTVDRSAMLICLGVVERDRPAGRAGDPTVEDLWDLVCEALPQHGAVSVHDPALGRGALLVRSSDVAAQTVWLSEDRLATVTVTSLRAEAPIRETARSLVRVLDRLLRDDRRSRPNTWVWPGVHRRDSFRPRWASPPRA